MGEPRIYNTDHLAGVFIIGWKAGAGMGFLAGMIVALCLASWVLSP